VTIRDNSAGSWGGGICSDSSNTCLENVTITDNSADVGGGMSLSFSSPSLRNVTIIGNTASEGGGIRCIYHSFPNLENVTISDNSASEYGGGIYCLISSDPSLINCILWNNAPQEVSFYQNYDPSSITISCSDIEGGEEGIETNDNGAVYWLENNIDEDPLFCDPDNGDYRLQLDSPCRTDVCGYMGYTGETCEGEGVEELVITPSQFAITKAYPNPFNPSTTVEYSLASPGEVLLSVYNTRGQLVDVIQKGYMSAGYHTAEWTPIHMPSGVYFIELRAGGQRNVMKVGYVK